MKRFAITLALCLTASLAHALPDAKDPWIRVETASFTLVSNASAKRTTRIGEKLEQLRLVLARTSAGFEMQSPLPTRIYVFRDASSFEPYNLGEDGRPRNWSGYFIGTPQGNYVAVDDSAGDEPFGVIYHEVLHDFLRNNVPRAPLWLTEGMAEFYSNLEFRSGRAEVGRPIPRHFLWLATHPLIPLDELFELDAHSPDYSEGSRQGTIYAQSWALTHYLLVDAKRRDGMNALVRLLASGMDSKPAFEKAFGTDLATVERELADYVRRESYGFFKVALPERPKDERVRIELLDRRQVLYLLADLLTYHSPPSFPAVEEHLNAILAQNDAYPDAYVGLAHVSLELGRPGRAVELCEKAMALDAGGGRAHAMYGRALMEQLRRGLVESSDLLAAPGVLLARAREQFRLALASDPDDVESLVGLGRSFRYDTDELAEGIEALTRVRQLLPARSDVLVDLIALTARSGDAAGAQQLLEETLHRYGDAASIAAAEAELVEAELQRAAELDRAGHPDQARERMRQVAGQLQDTRLKLSIWTRLASMSSSSATDEVIQMFNRAVIAADHGDSHTAITLLEQVIASTDLLDLRSAAETHLAEVRRVARYNRLVGRYNEAVRRARGGDLDVAENLLREVLQGDIDPDLRSRSRGLLREVSRARKD